MDIVTHLHDLLAHEGLSDSVCQIFIDLIHDYYRKNRRVFDWRHTQDPYRIFISEVMLQQTQTSRVEQMYRQWCSQFPNFERLAQASFVDVLRCWQGLGYNRRAQYLHKAAQQVINDYQGVLPNDPQELIKLPGIGPNTAGSICAFAFNTPVVFIETNIRAVFLHCFFPGQVDVADKQLMPLIERTLDRDNPREWYYALMDFGVMLKKRYTNPSRCSRHHARQSKFEGSDRQVRAKILRLLLQRQPRSADNIARELNVDFKRAEKIIDHLDKQNMIIKKKGQLTLP